MNGDFTDLIVQFQIIDYEKHQLQQKIKGVDKKLRQLAKDFYSKKFHFLSKGNVLATINANGETEFFYANGITTNDICESKNPFSTNIIEKQYFCWADVFPIQTKGINFQSGRTFVNSVFSSWKTTYFLFNEKDLSEVKIKYKMKVLKLKRPEMLILIKKMIESGDLEGQKILKELT